MSDEMYLIWKFGEALDKCIIEFMDMGLSYDAIIGELADKIKDLTVSKRVGEYVEHTD